MDQEVKTTVRYGLKDFIPLITLFVLVVGFVCIGQLYRGFDLRDAMIDFMAAFFLLFGALKVINLQAFAQAYAMYDLIAKRSKVYAYLYPFLEIGLGMCYLFRWFLIATNIITCMVMLLGALGVALELKKGRTVTCACLGMVFKVPMTYVTLLEDLLMALMALVMLMW